MGTNFSPCKGSYVLNQFPSNVMFGMNGFHVSASGAIQGHHGPLVFFKTGWYRIEIRFRGHFAMPNHFETIYFKTCLYFKTGCNKAPSDEVSCTRTIAMACIFFSYFPFIIFHQNSDCSITRKSFEIS